MQRSRLASFSTSTLETLSSENYTSTLDSTASTITGPGSLAGKALFNFGKFTLKGIEQLIISRRMSVIAAHFPHHDGDSIVGLPEMYADLLEMARIHLYSDPTRTRALQLLLGQIASRSTRHLVRALSVWSIIEVNLLLSQLLQSFDPLRNYHLLKNNTEQTLIFSFYQQYLSKWEDHSLAPIVDFLRDFASSSEQGWSIIYDCGYLDFLLHLYVSDFADPAKIRTGPFNKSSLSATCSSFLVEVLANDSARANFHSHVVCSLWTLWPMLALGTPNDTRCSQRRQAWPLVGTNEIQWRICSIFDTLVLEWDSGSSMRKLRVSLKEPSLFDLFIDLLEFSGSPMLDDEVCFRALRSLHRLWTRIYTTEVNWGLEKYIQETPPDYVQGIFTQLVRQLHILSGQNLESDTFFDFCREGCQKKGCPLKLDAVVHFIHRFTRASRSNKVLRQLLIEGDIVRLLDSTFSHLSERGALSLDDNHTEGSNKSNDNSVNGPRYRTLVLSLALRLFNKKEHGENDFIPAYQSSASLFFATQNPSPSWDDLAFPIQHHDNWADDLMSVPFVEI
ncbi:hypothetical protein J3R30DRAFT_3698502 [Lentinula aciculospora]|uniref:Uncharacterized protein n=1 Tax=Lentinula aciculospora TaxID=153920 RepID=A0A9W9DSK1_9AGAR|nr:hypothetical protein J3R30DRAFT_3698502 [Lentinula aciculospora]